MISTPHKIHLLLLLLFLVSPILCRMDYTGYTLIILTTEDKDTSFLQKFLDDCRVDSFGLPGGRRSILVPPDLAEDLIEELNEHNITYKINTRNIQDWIDEEYKQNPPDDASAGNSNNFPLNVYHTLKAITARIDSLANSNKNIAKVETIGTTFEGKPLKMLKISTGQLLPSNLFPKPIIWIDSGIHAREWITPATSLYIIHQLLDKGGRDPKIKIMLQKFDWYFWPVVNPDGYNHTWFKDRLWRKNRAPSLRNSSCVGTDLNRNFGVGFGDSTGADTDPCRHFYHGPSSFSENETKAYRDTILKLRKRIKAVVSLHSYSQLLMSPYGYKTEHPPDYNKQKKVLDVMKSAIERTHGKNYKTGTIADVIYKASGCSTDWVYDKGNIVYSFIFELRDTGDKGFFLPNSEIIPTAEEIFAAIMAMANIIN